MMTLSSSTKFHRIIVITNFSVSIIFLSHRSIIYIYIYIHERPTKSYWPRAAVISCACVHQQYVGQNDSDGSRPSISKTWTLRYGCPHDPWFQLDRGRDEEIMGNEKKNKDKKIGRFGKGVEKYHYENNGEKSCMKTKKKKQRIIRASRL